MERISGNRLGILTAIIIATQNHALDSRVIRMLKDAGVIPEIETPYMPCRACSLETGYKERGSLYLIDWSDSGHNESLYCTRCEMLYVLDWDHRELMKRKYTPDEIIHVYGKPKLEQDISIITRTFLTLDDITERYGEETKIIMERIIRDAA